MSCEITNRLRTACDERGIKYACGYRIGGNLFCADALDVEQAIGAYLAGKAQ